MTSTPANIWNRSKSDLFPTFLSDTAAPEPRWPASGLPPVERRTTELAANLSRLRRWRFERKTYGFVLPCATDTIQSQNALSGGLAASRRG